MITPFIVITFTVVYQVFTLWQCRHLRMNIKDISLGGIVCALTLVLSLIMIPLPTGATITCGSIIPLMLLALVYDARLAMLCGWICGVLSVFFVPGWQIVHWGQFFVEHLICYSCLGYAGVFGSNNRRRVLLGCMLAVMIKIVAHVFSGVLFFSQNSWAGWGAWGYSAAYNLSAYIPEGIIALAILLVRPLSGIKIAIKGRSI